MGKCERPVVSPEFIKYIEGALAHNGYVLVLPDDDKDFNARVAAAFRAKLNGRSGMVIEGDMALEAVSLYSLYEFSGKVIIGSLDEPYGRKLRNLLDSGIATKEELINDVLLEALNGTHPQA